MSSEEELNRQDIDAYCPRHDEQVLILGGTCFCKNRDRACSGCVLDNELIRVKLIWIMSEILQESSLEKKESDRKVAGESLGSLTTFPVRSLKAVKDYGSVGSHSVRVRPPKATFKIFGRTKL